MLLTKDISYIPVGDSNSTSESEFYWYATEDGSLAFALDNAKNIEHLIFGGSDIINFATFSHSFVPYDSSMNFSKNYLGEVQVGDYVLIDNDASVLYGVLRNNTILFQISPSQDQDIYTLTLNPNASLEDYIS